MQTYQYTCARRETDGSLVVIEGLLTPPKVAETPSEALNQLADWLIENKCVPYKRCN